jgi:hypothetical protein
MNADMLRWLIEELKKPNCPVDATNLAAAVLSGVLAGIEEDTDDEEA